jgi:hypothetical protein
MNTFPPNELGFRSQIVNAAGSKLVGQTIYTLKNPVLISPAAGANQPLYTTASTANQAPVTTLLHPFATSRIIAGATIYKLLADKQAEVAVYTTLYAAYERDVAYYNSSLRVAKGTLAP